MDKIKEAINWCDEKLKYAENPTTVNELKQYLLSLQSSSVVKISNEEIINNNPYTQYGEATKHYAWLDGANWAVQRALSSVVNSAGVKGAYDFLEAKFGYFNSHHPIGHLGYTKGMELDIEDIINCMEEYKSQSSSVKDDDGEVNMEDEHHHETGKVEHPNYFTSSVKNEDNAQYKSQH